jgi:hypothetical protein
MRQARIATLHACCLLAVLVFFAPRIAAQGLFGTVSGVVTDPSGAVVPGATVKVTNVNTNVVTTLTTNNVGAYNATSLNPGTYNVQAEAQGFKTAVVSNIALGVNANPKVDLVLEVGTTTQVVEVKAEAPLLQSQQTSLGQTVGQRLIDQLPTQSGNGRSVYNLLFLTAGVSEQVGGSPGNNANLRINGDRPRDQDYILDGTSITAPVFGGQSVSPGVDSIQEFRVETNSMSAEWGKSGGGVIIVVTKSGTNNFHGSVYEYLRNEKLDARNYFEDPTKPKNPFKYNEFGGTIGGPIIKDKLFFFTDYRGIRRHGSVPSAGNRVPDAAFRSGDLSALCSAGFDGSGNCLDPAGQIYYPGTTTPVAYNDVSGQISPIADKFLAVYPTSSTADPGVPGTSIVNFNSASTQSLNSYNPRVDYNFSSSDHLFGAFHKDTGPSTAYDLAVGGAGEQISRTHDYALTAGWTHTFASSLLNEFRFGYMHRIGARAQFGQGFTSPADFGISGIPDCLSSIPDTANGAKCGTPGVTITGFTGLPVGSTIYEPAAVFHFSDTVTKLVGRHSLKMGADFRHYTIDNYQPNNVVGSFTFNGSQTGNGYADFLFGALASGSKVQVQNAMVSTRAWAYSFFVQDDFKVTSKLTLNLGLRYQYDQSFHEIHNGLAFFNPFTAEWEQFGVNAPSTPFDPSKKQFGPRVGLAWNALKGFVVRAGYGIMFPSTVGHGRAGDGEPGPNLLANTPIPGGTNWSNLPTITSPDPSAITAPLPVNANVSGAAWAPRKRAATYNQLWNFTLEKQIGANAVAQLAYVGSRGVHLPINYAYNICQQSPASTLEFGWDATTSPYCAPEAAELAGDIWNLYIFPGWWGLSSSTYHSLQAKFDRRFSNGFSLLANFTWSKLIDDSSSDWGGFWSLDVLGQDFYNRRAERSVSAGDVPVRFTVAPIYELPLGPGKKWAQGGVASQVIGGWRVAGIYTVSGGYPFGITDNSYGYCNAAHTWSNRPMMVGNPLPAGFNQTTQHWFDISAFDFSGTCPAPGLVGYPGYDTTKAFGSAPRFFSNIRVPGVNSIDLSLQKDFKIPLGEQTRLTFRADFYNAPNHPQFGAPNSDPGVSNFGTVTSTAINNRTIQLGLHLYF